MGQFPCALFFCMKIPPPNRQGYFFYIRVSKSNALDLFYCDSYLFAVDVPFLGVFSVSR